MTVSAGVTVPCATCGAPVPVAPSHAKRGHRKTCSSCPKLNGAPPTKTAVRVVLTCTHCRKVFTRRQCDIKPGSDPFCSPPCANTKKKTIQSNKAAKFGRESYPDRQRPTAAGPAQWQWPIDSGSSAVVCHRCSRERARGVRCVCEKRGPDDES